MICYTHPAPSIPRPRSNGQPLCDLGVLEAAALRAGFPEPRKFLESQEGLKEVEEELRSFAVRERVTGALRLAPGPPGEARLPPGDRGPAPAAPGHPACPPAPPHAGVPFFVISDGKNKVTLSGAGAQFFLCVAPKVSATIQTSSQVLGKHSGTPFRSALMYLLPELSADDADRFLFLLTARLSFSTTLQVHSRRRSSRTQCRTSLTTEGAVMSGG